jgi:hypothetical protein
MKSSIAFVISVCIIAELSIRFVRRYRANAGIKMSGGLYNRQD